MRDQILLGEHELFLGGQVPGSFACRRLLDQRVVTEERGRLERGRGCRCGGPPPGRGVFRGGGVPPPPPRNREGGLSPSPPPILLKLFPPGGAPPPPGRGGCRLPPR